MAMDIIKKRRQIRSLRLIFAECLIMLTISACVCGILYGCFYEPQTEISYLPLAQFVTGLIALGIVALKDMLLSKINFPTLMISLAFVYGILLFEFLLSWGLKNFLYLAAAAVFIFVLTAAIGFYFGYKINQKKIYASCFYIAFLGLFFEMVCLIFGFGSEAIAIIIALLLCGGMLNLADFSKYNRITYGLRKDYPYPNADYELALILFINFLCGFAATDATRLISKLTLYNSFKKIIY